MYDDLKLFITDLNGLDSYNLEFDEKQKFDDTKFVITLFGRDKNKKSFTVLVENFQPYFYVKLPDNLKQKSKLNGVIDYLNKKLFQNKKVITYTIVRSKPFYGFTGKDTFLYVKLLFQTKTNMNRCKHYLKTETVSMDTNTYKFETYESNLPPVLRFIHINEISPSGWIKIKKEAYDYVDDLTVSTDEIIRCDYKDIIPEKNDTIGSYCINAFDIEALSSHGDFPLAKKDYYKTANQILNAYVKIKDEAKTLSINKELPLYTQELIKKNKKLLKSNDLIYQWLVLIFDDYFFNNKINYINNDSLEVLFNSKEHLKYIYIHLFDSDKVLIYIKKVLNKEDDKQIVYNKDISIDSDLTSQLTRFIEQLRREVKRLEKDKNEIYFKQKEKVFNFIVKLGYNKYYNNIELDNVYTKTNKKPSKDTLIQLSNDILAICSEHEDKKLFDVNVKKIQKLCDEYLPVQEGDIVTQIGNTMQYYGESDCYNKTILVLDSCDEITNKELIEDEHSGVEYPSKLLKSVYKEYDESIKSDFNKKYQKDKQKEQLKTDKAEVIVKSFKTERELLLAWKDLIIEEDFDILTGYNIFGFDYKFIYYRVKELGIEDEFMNMGKILSINERFRQFIDKKLESKGLGANEMNYIDMFGRISIDLLKIIQASKKLSSYKLDYVCKLFLFQEKNDVSPQEIFELSKGNSQDRKRIARYCLIDCVLCNRLLNKLQILSQYVAMSNVCYVPLMMLVFRGQGIKAYSLVARFCRLKNYLIVDLNKDNQNTEDNGYEGAIVLSAYTAIYLTPVSVPDFNSLYPSVMLAENLSHDKLLLDKKYDNLSDYEYKNSYYDEFIYLNKPIKKILNDLSLKIYVKPTVFVKFGDVKNEKVYKNVDDYLGDTYKNKSILSTKKVKLNLYEEIYENDKLIIKKKQRCCRFVQSENDNKGIVPEILETLLKSRKDVRKIQKNYEVNSFEWLIYEGQQLAYKVTANSIYGQCGAKTSDIYLKDVAASTTAGGRNQLENARDYIEGNYKDSKCIYGDSVLGDEPLLLLNTDNTICIKTIESLIDFQEKWLPYENFKPFDTIQSNRTEKQKAFIDRKVWANGKWNTIKKVIRHKTNKKIYRVTTRYGSVDVTEDHSLLDKDLNKLKPEECIVHKTRLSHSYPDYSVNRLDKKLDSSILCNTKLEASITYHHFKKSGYQPIIKVSYDQYYNTYYSIHVDSEYKVKEKDTVIENIRLLHNNYTDYVYDLETEDGIFQCGVGEIQVKNTDSLFIKFKPVNEFGKKLYGLDAIYHSMMLCTEGAYLISKNLRKPHNLAFEKTIYPFLLPSKKRYHGHYYEEYGIDKFDIKSMGLELKRRDNAPIVKIVLGKMIDIIMFEQNFEKALWYVYNTCVDILNGKYPIENFIVSKTLNNFYKNPQQIAHKVLADRVAKRDPGQAFSTNDRVPYVSIVVHESKNVKLLQGDKIEIPSYVIKNKLKIDYKHYITNGIMKPILKIINLVTDDFEPLLNELIDKHNVKAKNQQTITTFFNSNKNEHEQLKIKINKIAEKINEVNFTEKIDNSDSESDID
jgi:DNA polymerase elongation subunit (family B)